MPDTGDHSDGWGLLSLKTRAFGTLWITSAHLIHRGRPDSPLSHPQLQCHRASARRPKALWPCKIATLSCVNSGAGIGFCAQRRPERFPPPLHGNFHPVGATDSEHAFCWIMQELAKSTPRCPASGTDPYDARVGSTHCRTAPSTSCFPTAGHCGRASTSLFYISAGTRLQAPICRMTTMCGWISPPNVAQRQGRRHCDPRPLTRNEPWDRFQTP